MESEKYERNLRIIEKGARLERLFQNPDFIFWKEMFFDKPIEDLKNQLSDLDYTTDEGIRSAAAISGTIKGMKKAGDTAFKFALQGVKEARRQIEEDEKNNPV